mmetsp:Transcript_51666/g.112333  ORF Transcript_51666/g.112333 Transcript_51666/m.112333 type:complete len:234 (+) Transcript_51666:907-1608(+)
MRVYRPESLGQQLHQAAQEHCTPVAHHSAKGELLLPAVIAPHEMDFGVDVRSRVRLISTFFPEDVRQHILQAVETKPYTLRYHPMDNTFTLDKLRCEVSLALRDVDTWTEQPKLPLTPAVPKTHPIHPAVLPSAASNEVTSDEPAPVDTTLTPPDTTTDDVKSVEGAGVDTRPVQLAAVPEETDEAPVVANGQTHMPEPAAGTEEPPLDPTIVAEAANPSDVPVAVAEQQGIA